MVKIKEKTSKNWFDPVTQNPNLPLMEESQLIEWQKEGIFKKYLVKNAKSKKLFRFLDGPITANNPMGVHHAWGRTYKDLFQRYKNMQGCKQRFQNGFDAQGLWVEVNVEKEMDLKSKHDIENLVKGDVFASIAKFVEACKERVRKFAAVQTEQSKRLGYFMDWDNSYITMSDENNYMIWYFLKKCHEKGLIYEGLDSVPWCPRCETAISNHEILTENYKELTHTAVTLKYPIIGRQQEYFLVWTTTPWTLPSNVAIAVNPKLVYSRVRVGSNIYYISRERIVPVLGTDVEVIEEISGDRLLGLTYSGPFDDLEAVEKVRRENPRTFHITVDGGEFVTNEEGTGLVHIAPGAGHEDFQLAKINKLSIIQSIDDSAKYLPGFGEFSGKIATKQEGVIFYLKEKDWLVKEEKYLHRYPVCWRCQTELVFRAVPEWYIAMDPLRAKMVRFTNAITWIPSFARERELDWIKNMDDWLISKKRYWGLALPIWKCKHCGQFDVIGGKEELKERAVSGWKEFVGHTPHRPWIDLVKIQCSRCGQPTSRVPDVGNVWLDAGIVPFSTVDYMTDKKYWDQWYPFEFITESFPGQFKGWFYALLAMASVLEDTEPFRTVLGFGTLLAEDGRPMHKSWGNAIEFGEGAQKIGVDVMRWMYAKTDPAKNLLFGYKVADETRRAFHLPLWNIYNFFVTYATFDKWVPRVSRVPQTTNILDKWILARLKQVGQITTESLDEYNAATASQAIENFVQDLSNWYIRRSRERVGPAAQSKGDKEAFYQTTYFVLLTLAKILAPFMPFMSEWIYKNLTKKESVHLTDWPELELPDKKDIEIIETMKYVRAAVEAGHAFRKSNNLKVRQPLAKAKISASIKSPSSAYLDLIKDELNVKSVVWTKKRVPEPVAELTTRLTAELIEEGKARELVREIQDLRKKEGLGLADTVTVISPWLPESKKLVNWVKAKTLAQELGQGEKLMVSRK